jgi:hypothetical protein
MLIFPGARRKRAFGNAQAIVRHGEPVQIQGFSPVIAPNSPLLRRAGGA